MTAALRARDAGVAADGERTEGSGAPRADLAMNTVSQLVSAVTEVLARGPVPDVEREARELISAVAGAPTHWTTLHRHDVIEEGLRTAALDAAARRALGAPLAYAVGTAVFRHLTLHVDERVLIPRPETEGLVGLVLSERHGSDAGVAVDVGTGSGAIALSLAMEGAFRRVVATDVSADALEVARANRNAAGVPATAIVELRHGSLLAGFCGPADVVVSNPPYVAFGEASSLPAGVRDWEPWVALYGGADGLRTTAAVIPAAAAVLAPAGLLALEVDSRRSGDVARLVARDARFGDIAIRPDIFGRPRYVTARRLEEQA